MFGIAEMQGPTSKSPMARDSARPPGQTRRGPNPVPGVMAGPCAAAAAAAPSVRSESRAASPAKAPWERGIGCSAVSLTMPDSSSLARTPPFCSTRFCSSSESSSRWSSLSCCRPRATRGRAPATNGSDASFLGLGAEVWQQASPTWPHVQDGRRIPHVCDEAQPLDHKADGRRAARQDPPLGKRHVHG